MRQWQRSCWLTGLFSVVLATAATAEPQTKELSTQPASISAATTPASPSLNEVPTPATTVKEWERRIRAQDLPEDIPSDELAPGITEITRVQLKTTEGGFELNLEAINPLEDPETTVVGKTLTAEIPNAVLALPEGEAFQKANPASGIAEIAVRNASGNRVRITLTGVEAVPTATAISGVTGLTLSVVPGTVQVGEEAEVEITVTAEEEEGYNPSNASTATRTDTPLRDIPQSIQVIPRQVLEDQQVTQLREATRNISGVIEGSNFGNGGDAFLIRGFQSNNILLDGIELGSSNLGLNSSFREPANIERVEVLKGPASVLFGTLEPGGIVNINTKKPLDSPFYKGEIQGGSFGLFRPSLDFSGPLNSDRTLRYRLNAVYQRADDFRDFDQGIERVFVTPVLSWAINDNTDLSLDFEYLYDERPFDRGLAAFGNGVADIPFERILGEPDDINIREQYVAGYQLEHRFSENWKLRNVFRYISTERQTRAFQNRGNLNEATGDLERSVDDQLGNFDSYALQTNIVGEFSTGPIEHTLLFGIDLFRETRDFDNRSALEPSIINIFDPVYGAPRPSRAELGNEDVFLFGGTVQTLGLFLQDQITLTDNLKLLIGGRFDIVDQDSSLTAVSAGDITNDTTDQQQDEAFSPRIGIVYQPIEPLSLYASFSRSFAPNSGTTVNGDILEPTRGTQYEVGVRGEFLEGRLTTNLAAYHLTKTNIAATDPDNTDFSIATGEQRSQGIELDVIGEILPGWNIIASYAYTD